MENKKAYFVDTLPESVYELSASNRKKLEKKHPEWHSYNVYDNTDELNEVYEFFKKHGKVLANHTTKNLFVGLTYL